MAEGDAAKRWDAERRESKRADIRLRQGLRSLEDAHLSSLKGVAKEQRRLQQELLKLQKCHSTDAAQLDLRPSAPTQSSPTGLSHREPQDGVLRSRRKTSPRAGGLMEASRPSRPLETHSSSERDKINAEEQIGTVDKDPTALGNFVAEQLTVSEAGAGQEEADGLNDGEGSPAEDGARYTEDKGTTKVVNLLSKQKSSAGNERLITDPEAYAADGRLRTTYMRPDFHKSYAGAQKARYIRHKSPAAWEKELSLDEIFGRKKPVE